MISSEIKLCLNGPKPVLNLNDILKILYNLGSFDLVYLNIEKLPYSAETNPDCNILRIEIFAEHPEKLSRNDLLNRFREVERINHLIYYYFTKYQEENDSTLKDTRFLQQEQEQG
jgi:hypothetical protein